MTMDKFSELKAAAMAATPGRIGDRIDGSGSIKYECTGYDGSLVLRTDHKDMEYGFVGDNADADELFFRLCVPDVVLELLAELKASQKALKGVTELWNDQRQRIAELEAIRADISQVLKEIGNELGCNPDNESIMMAIDALKEREKRVVALAGGNAELWETMAARLEAAEAKLATPLVINLPERRDDSHDWDGVSQTEAFNTCRSICGLMFRQQLRAAGFTVGD
ncbi:hypothetical protein [Serratia marcescens]